MLSQDLQTGDVLLDPVDGDLIYTVKEVEVGPTEVRALVSYATDGGTAERVWDWGKEVPLTRPS